MTQAEWLVCENPGPMLALVCGGRAGERKLRLLSVACQREVWEHFTDEARVAIEAHEAYADGLIDESSLASAIDGVRPIEVDGVPQGWAHGHRFAVHYSHVGWGSEFILRPGIIMAWAASLAAESAARNVEPTPRMHETWRMFSHTYRGKSVPSRRPEDLRAVSESAMRSVQAGLLREIFGNPFRPSSIDPAWLAWNNGTIPCLARAIYDEKAFDRMPILGDALEEAGCADANILDHCRGPSEHVRGCWVLDDLLGRV